MQVDLEHDIEGFGIDAPGRCRRGDAGVVDESIHVYVLRAQLVAQRFDFFKLCYVERPHQDVLAQWIFEPFQPCVPVFYPPIGGDDLLSVLYQTPDDRRAESAEGTRDERINR